MPKKGQKLNLSGVAGTFVGCGEVGEEELDFSSKKTKLSPYDKLLLKLKDSQVGTMIRFESITAKNSLRMRAKILNLKLVFAEKDDKLYVKYIGSTIIEITEELKDQTLEILKDFSPITSKKLQKHFIAQFNKDLSVENIDDVLNNLKRTKEVTMDINGMWSIT